jgi:hypothetical protein
MRCAVVTVLVTALLGWCASCVENEPPPAQAHDRKPVTILSPPAAAEGTTKVKPTERQQVTRAEREAQQKQVVRASAAAPQVPDGAPAAPKGAQFTIFCGRVQGDAHVERASKIKGDLISSTGLRDFYVLHEDGQSLLYYGYYRTFNDPKDAKEAARAQADLKRIKALESDGNRLFAGALFVDMEAPDPQAPPEWNLVNARGAWSLQIAAYKDSPLRKEAAVEAVREARKQGIEAYYYHGETVSSVCVGAWPEGAIRYVSPTNDVHKSVIVNQPVIADPSQATPMSADQQRERARKANAEVVQGKVEVVDATLLATMKQYPSHAVNGMQTVKSINGQTIPDPSLLIRIPAPAEGKSILTSVPPHGTEPSALRQQPVQRKADPRPAARKSQPPPPQPGLGKLKSIDG